MQLFHSPTSPFVRKVMASAHLLGLADRFELLPSATNIVKRDATIAPHNPLGKVPTAILDDGQILADSRSICEYLDSLSPEAGLFPKGAARWEALRIHAIADGMLDAALLGRYETAIRPAELRWDDLVAGYVAKIEGGLEALEASTASFEGKDDIASITVGCALGYLDLRYPHLNWRDKAPKIAAWFEGYSQRPHMAATAA